MISNPVLDVPIANKTHVSSRRLTPRRLLNNVVLYALLIVASIVVLFPLYYVLVSSLLSAAQASSYPPTLFPTEIHLENYTAALQQAPLLRYLLNSGIQSGAVMVGEVILASLAAFAFAFIDFKWKNFFFLLFLSTMMIPWEATIIPNYLFVRGIGWGDTYQGLAVPFLATAFGTFLLRQFFMGIPRDLRDAATIDGCGNFRFLLTIVLPLARPAIGTLAVYAFLQTYNQFLWPLLITSVTEMRTVQIGISLLQDEERFTYSIASAGIVIILLPTIILFVLANRQLIRGLTAGAIKG